MPLDDPRCFFLRKHKWTTLHPSLDLIACSRCGKVKVKINEDS